MYKESVNAPQSLTTEPAHVTALMADLQILDERIHLAIERLRATVGDAMDSAQRGLIIEEGDVDGWLSKLGDKESTVDQAGAAKLPANRGGRLAALGSFFGLGQLEQAMLLTTLAPEVDLSYANLYAYVQDDVTKKFPTLDLAVSLWCETLPDKLMARRLIASDGNLRRQLLLSVDDSPVLTSPLLARPMLLDPRIAAYLLGADDTDPALGNSVRVVRPSAAVESTLSSNQLRSLERLVRPIMGRGGPVGKSRNGASSGNGSHAPVNSLVVWMRGFERQGKRMAAEHLAAMLDCPMLVVDSAALVSAGPDQRKLMLRVLREARLQGAIIFWAEADALAPKQEGGRQDLPVDLANLLIEWPGCSFFDIRGVQPLHVPSVLSIELDFPIPTNERRRRLWDYALAGVEVAPDVDLGLLTGAFKLSGEQIDAAADSARHAAAWRAASSGDKADAHVTMRDLLAACRQHSNQGLGLLARKVTPVYTWGDLVLPADRFAQLHEMCLHIKHGPLVFEDWGFDRKLARGKGLNVLFAGQPGTGKTMAAEVLATDLGLELYKIDLSGVVSKYIGETEKNLEKIFHEGQTSNAILFFDEADSLFGKRSEVKDSHDRYANLEISYLLQRMEEYDGIVILATNLRKNLDDAFIRRMHGAIEFPMPEEPDRLEIWQRTFPHEAPRDPNIDFPFLAKRFKLSGGNIKNIVLEAAFFAAEAGTPISMGHVVRALRREHQKIGKLIHESDFGPYVHLVKGEEAAV
jgi:SpoVK/Ycf46/Vps4 family AAA+-type ATPase